MIVAERVAGATRTWMQRTRSPRWVLTALACASVLLIILPFVLRLDGRAHADWLQFFGRFHPTLLHLPIGLIVLVPVLEIAGAKRPALREAAEFVLAIAH